MLRLIFNLILAIALCSCAQKGAPSGGPKDVTPPLFLKSTPDTFATNVDRNLREIKIDFDEYINLKDPTKQIIISPPLASNPIIYPSNNKPRKYVLIELKDTLEPNTTYNINFGESIVDNNEGNALSLFNYVFTTGEAIDSLTLSGNVKQALSTEQNKNTVLTLYKKDTAEIDLQDKPYYVTKADTVGNFKFDYLHQGEFKLIGFTDENNNLRYDPEELIAFSDSLVNPENPGNYNLVLAENKPDFKFIKSEQTGQGEIEIRMQGKPKTFNLKPLDENFVNDYQVIHKAFADTAYVFFNANDLPFKDAKERIEFEITADSNSDSISVLYDKKITEDLKISINQKQISPADDIILTISTATEKLNRDSITVFEDSIAIDYLAAIDSLNPKRIRLKFTKNFEKSYFIEMFPGAFTDQMAQTNDSLNFQVKTLTKNEYGNLKVALINAPKDPFFFQLMEKDKVVRSTYGKESNYNFDNIFPGEYYFRILVDENQNGIWDIADFNENKQAEKTFIYKNKVLIRAFWDLNETWTLP